MTTAPTPKTTSVGPIFCREPNESPPIEASQPASRLAGEEVSNLLRGRPPAQANRARAQSQQAERIALCLKGSVASGRTTGGGLSMVDYVAERSGKQACWLALASQPSGELVFLGAFFLLPLKPLHLFLSRAFQIHLYTGAADSPASRLAGWLAD